ncbi:hypothetical protein [Burkholderia sp. PU8-34]
MPIYRDSDPTDQSEIMLASWSIRETQDGTRYFVGFSLERQDGRVSTSIVSLDPSTRIGVTSSGRHYRLVGRAGFDSDAEYVWNLVVSVRNLGEWRDVTPDVCPDWREPLSATERAREIDETSGSKDVEQ